MLIALSSSHLPPNVARVLRATGSQEFCDFISPCYILGTESQSLLYVISNFRVGWIVLGKPPPLRMLGKGTRVQDSKCCAVHTTLRVGLLCRVGGSSEHGGLLLQFLLLDARWSACPPRHHQPGRGSCGAPADPLACVHSFHGETTR